MIGEAHWITLAFLLAGALGVLALVYGTIRLERRYQVFRRKLECWRKGKAVAVEADLVRDQKTGKYTAVQTCSAFENPDRVTCDQACLKDLNGCPPEHYPHATVAAAENSGAKI